MYFVSTLVLFPALPADIRRVPFRPAACLSVSLSLAKGAGQVQIWADPVPTRHGEGAGRGGGGGHCGTDRPSGIDREDPALRLPTVTGSWRSPADRGPQRSREAEQWEAGVQWEERSPHLEAVLLLFVRHSGEDSAAAHSACTTESDRFANRTYR